MCVCVCHFNMWLLAGQASYCLFSQWADSDHRRRFPGSNFTADGRPPLSQVRLTVAPPPANTPKLSENVFVWFDHDVECVCCGCVVFFFLTSFIPTGCRKNYLSLKFAPLLFCKLLPFADAATRRQCSSSLTVWRLRYRPSLLCSDWCFLVPTQQSVARHSDCVCLCFNRMRCGSTMSAQRLTVDTDGLNKWLLV